MSVSIQADVSGTSGTVKVNSNTAFTFDASGVFNATTVQHNGTATERISLGTAVATTSGTTVDITGIPSWAKKITVMLNGVSTNGTSLVGIQLGTSSGFATSGYLGGLIAGVHGNNTYGTNFSSMFIASGNIAVTDARYGLVTLSLLGSNLWVAGGTVATSSGLNASTFGGGIALGGVLDRIRFTTANGTFDAGSVNILIEG